MEQFMSAHSMSMLTADSIDPNHHDLVITALAMQQLTMTDQPAHPAAPHPKPSAQSAPQSCILQLDTLSGRAELLSMNGQHLADVHFTLVDSTWFMWLSVDPLADKNIQNSPYMYCKGNPIMLVDPDGRDVWELSEDGTIVHKITDKTQDAIRINNQQISFDYGTMANANQDGLNGPTTFEFTKNKENEAAATFKFLADNSQVEYALANTADGSSAIYTTHHRKDMDCLGFIKSFGEQHSGLVSFYHNHPSGGTIPSGFLPQETHGDKYAVGKLGANVSCYVYSPTTSNVREFSSNYYFSQEEPWKYGAKGIISSNVKPSKMYYVVYFFTH